MLSDVMLGAIEQIAVALNGEGVPMAVTCGIAVAAWDHFRATVDLDLLVGVESADLERVLHRLAIVGVYAKHNSPILAIDDLRVMQLRYRPRASTLAVQIDLLLADSEFHRQALARRKQESYAGVPVPVDVMSAEDLIVHKLIMGRAIDFADAAYLLRFQRDNLELDYLIGWIKKLNLTAEFQQIWDEGFPGEPPPPLPPEP